MGSGVSSFFYDDPSKTIKKLSSPNLRMQVRVIFGSSSRGVAQM